MRIGVMLNLPGGDATLDGEVQQAQQAEAAGFASAWLPNTFELDALTTLAIIGRETQRLELGTAIVPSYPRHPTVMAQQALTTQAACRGRFTLGIGLSHQIVIENMLGLDYSRPVPHMREYLTVLNGLLAGEQVKYRGEIYRVNAKLTVPGATRPPVVVAALGPAMLKLSGRLADGTITWMGGLNYLRDTAIPIISAAALQAGRPAPRVICGAPVCITNDVEATRMAANKLFAIYGQLPSYRATLDRGGAGGPGDVAVIGDQASVVAQIRAYAALGVTDFVGSPFADAPGGSITGTLETLAVLAREAAVSA